MMISYEKHVEYMDELKKLAIEKHKESMERFRDFAIEMAIITGSISLIVGLVIGHFLWIK